MVASDTFAEFLRDALAPLGHVTLRRRLGKTGVFSEGLMLAMGKDDALHFRVAMRTSCGPRRSGQSLEPPTPHGIGR